MKKTLLLFVVAVLQAATPIDDLGAGLYLGTFQGGLYENGTNLVPTDHAIIGQSAAAGIVARDGAGNPSPSGKIGLLAIGMSNTDLEWCSGSNKGTGCSSNSFMGQ